MYNDMWNYLEKLVTAQKRHNTYNRSEHNNPNEKRLSIACDEDKFQVLKAGKLTGCNNDQCYARALSLQFAVMFSIIFINPINLPDTAALRLREPLQIKQKPCSKHDNIQ